MFFKNIQTPIAALIRWLAAAADKSILLRSVKTACVVGCVLAAINHGPELLAGSIEPEKFARILLTFLVPFGVATFAGVAGKRNQQKRSDEAVRALNRQMDAVKRFPDANPSPVLRVAASGSIEYGNAASKDLFDSLGIQVGMAFPEPLLHQLQAMEVAQKSDLVEVEAGHKTYALRSTTIATFGFVNIYAIDVTAAKVITKLPTQNPHPVMQVTGDGVVLYFNPAAEVIQRSLNLSVGGHLPMALRTSVQSALESPASENIEITCAEKIYELKAVSIPELGAVNLYGVDVTANRLLSAAHKENERLLLSILPKNIADRLRSGEPVIADQFDEVSILFADLVSFTELSATLKAARLVTVLNGLFAKFDDISNAYGVEKIKTIGDCYMAVAGLLPGDIDHARRTADMGLAMIKAVKDHAEETGLDLDIRVGIHTGPAVAGVMGKKKFIFDIWGDAVNVASRMESHGLKGEVHVSAHFADLVSQTHVVTPHGTTNIKGKGLMPTFLVHASEPLICSIGADI